MRNRQQQILRARSLFFSALIAGLIRRRPVGRTHARLGSLRFTRVLVAVVPIEVLPRVEVRAAHLTVEFVSMSHDATPVAKYDVISAQTALGW